MLSLINFYTFTFFFIQLKYEYLDRLSNFGKFKYTFESFVIILKAVVDEDAHLGLAHQLYKSGNYKQALEHSSVVYERSPQRTDNLLLLGAIYYQVVFHSDLFASFFLFVLFWLKL